MTDKEKIKEQANIDISNLRMAQEQGIITEFGKGKLEALEGIVNFIDSLQEEPVSEDLEKAVQEYCDTHWVDACVEVPAFKAGAQWQKKHLWKPADGDDLPEVDREVVAFQETFPTDVDIPSLFQIVIAHRPNPNGYNGKSLTTGKVEHYTPKIYGKGGWNIPNVKWWLDCDLPNEIEK